MGLLNLVLLSSAMAAEAAALESLQFIGIIGGVFILGFLSIGLLSSVKFETSSEQNEDIIDKNIILPKLDSNTDAA